MSVRKRRNSQEPENTIGGAGNLSKDNTEIKEAVIFLHEFGRDKYAEDLLAAKLNAEKKKLLDINASNIKLGLKFITESVTDNFGAAGVTTYHLGRVIDELPSTDNGTTKVKNTYLGISRSVIVDYGERVESVPG